MILVRPNYFWNLMQLARSRPPEKSSRRRSKVRPHCPEIIALCSAGEKPTQTRGYQLVCFRPHMRLAAMSVIRSLSGEKRTHCEHFAV